MTAEPPARSLAPLDSIEDRVVQYLRRTGVTDAARVIRLHGDASNRAYLRVVPQQEPSFVLAVYPEPFHAGTLRQLRVSDLLGRLAIPVPTVLGHAGELGILALEDLGQDTLQDWLEDREHDPTPVYRQAVDLIVALQRAQPLSHDSPEPPFDIGFDQETLARELAFFRSEFLGAYRRVAISAIESRAFDREFRAIAEDLARETRVLCHRDYHSRNLMVRQQQLVVIDFQDARWGPCTYDLVSLLCDCYVDLKPELVSEMTDRFLAATPNGRSDSFGERFDLMSVQRHLKALGTFGHQIAVANRHGFASAVPRTLRYLRRTLHDHDRFAGLHDLLQPHLPELRP
jgi:hypothetical protein